MEKSEIERNIQKENITKWGKKKLLDEVRARLILLDKDTPYLTKEEKLELLSKKKYKMIKNSPNSLQSYKDNREIINKEKNKIDNFYQKHNIDKKYLENAKTTITKILKKRNIKNREFYRIMQLINWERFLININKYEEWKDCYIQMEIKNINNDEIKQKYQERKIKSNKIVSRHIDSWINLLEIDKKLLEGKKNILDKIPEYKDIPFIQSKSRLRNKNLINLLKENNNKKKNKQSNIVNTFEQEVNNYASYLWEEKEDKTNWQKFVEKGSTVERLILGYEKENCPLKDGKILIDIEKMKKYFNKK